MDVSIDVMHNGCHDEQAHSDKEQEPQDFRPKRHRLAFLFDSSIRPGLLLPMLFFQGKY
jgi:hypothetical protein